MLLIVKFALLAFAVFCLSATLGIVAEALATLKKVFVPVRNLYKIWYQTPNSPACSTALVRATHSKKAIQYLRSQFPITKINVRTVEKQKVI